MEAVCEDMTTKEIPLHGLTPEQYLKLVALATQQLRWPIVAATGNSITFQNSYDPFLGSNITITATPEGATLDSKPFNEYYCDSAYTEQSIAALLQRIDHAAKEAHLAHRNMLPQHREKWGALIPSKTYLATPLLVYANVLVFLAMVLSGTSLLHPTAQNLFVWGGNLRPAVAAGDWWRLVTYIFLHGGAMHLIMNTFALLFIGMYLEPLIGKLRFTAAYLLAGVGAGLMSIAMHPASVGVGASGAIFGMYGVFVALLTTGYIKKTLRKTMLRTILFFVLLNLLWGLEGNTDNAAHIGGLLGGLFIGFAYTPGILKQQGIKMQIATTAVIAICVAAAVFAATLYLR